MNRGFAVMAHNTVHLARILAANPIPADGNTVPDWHPA
jgi:hypothetical protein